MFTYHQVESALATLHGVNEQTIGAFRGRIKNLQRLGITPSSPGKGRKISYGLEDVFVWAVAFEFIEFGLDPATIKTMLAAYWRDISEAILSDDKGKDRFLFFSPSLLGARFPEQQKQSLDNRFGAPFSVTFGIVTDAAEILTQALTAVGRANGDRFLARYGMINLSRLRRETEKWLQHVSK